MRLAGKVALVTGAQQGIGKAIALAYGREGASVVINYVDGRAAADEIASSSLARGHKAVAVAGDVSKAADVARLMEAGRTLGGIDVLVNNAGIFPRVDFLQMTEGQWDEVLDVNLKGTFLCTQAAAREMVERGRGVSQLTARRALRGEQGGDRGRDPRRRAGVSVPPGARECHRPRAHRYRSAALWHVRGGAPGGRAPGAAGADRHAGRRGGACRLSRLRGIAPHHGTDDPRQRRAVPLLTLVSGTGREPPARPVPPRHSPRRARPRYRAPPRHPIAGAGRSRSTPGSPGFPRKSPAAIPRRRRDGSIPPWCRSSPRGRRRGTAPPPDCRCRGGSRD